MTGHEGNQRLRAVAARLELQMERMPIGCVFNDTSFRFTYWNPAAERIFGYSLDEVLGKHPNELIVPPSSQELVQTIFERLAAGDMLAHGTSENVTKDGRTILCEWHNTPLMGPDGKFDGLMSMVQDVTDRRNLEEQLRQSQKMEAIGRLAGGIAHDFNNLLTAILGYSGLLLDSPGPSEVWRAHVSEIQEAGRRAGLLTQQLLAFSRKQVLEPRILNLNALIVEVERMLARIIGEQVRLVTELSPDLGQVRADNGQMQQVLLNLVVNARDAMPAGGKVVIETQNVTLSVRDVSHQGDIEPGDYVLVAVSDSGAGMSEMTRTRMFEPFFTTKGREQGTGLGLATVHGIVSQSGGSIQVESTLGRGSTFRIYLPRVFEEVDDQFVAVEAPVVGGSETILLVEDEDQVRKLASQILRQHGYTVLEADTGPAALALVGRHQGRIDMVLTDAVMPGLSSTALVEQLTAQRPELRVCYMSGYANDAIVQRGVEAGTTAFLPKPFSSDDLLRKVRGPFRATSVRRCEKIESGPTGFGFLSPLRGSLGRRTPKPRA